MSDDEILQLEVELTALHLVQADLQDAISWRIRRLHDLKYGDPLPVRGYDFPDQFYGQSADSPQHG
jgi:ribosomal protein S13